MDGPAAAPAAATCFTLRTLRHWLGCVTGVLPGRETVRRLVKRFPAPWANAETTCQMLRLLRDSYPDRRLVVIWDNVCHHLAVAVRTCAQELGIELWNLPAYSPDLMPVERLWHWVRQQLTAVHCHRDEHELADRLAGFEAYLNQDPSAVHTRLRPKTSWTRKKRNCEFEAGRGLDSPSRTFAWSNPPTPANLSVVASRPIM